jgi:hypothetical protein
MFSEGDEDPKEGSLNKFSHVGDQNYSRVRRDIRTIFRDDSFIAEVYNGTLNNKKALDGMLKRFDLSEPKRYGNMAVHIYSRLGHKTPLEVLLEDDFDLTAKTEKPDPKAGQTALRIAVENLQLDIVRLLLTKGAPTDPLDKEMHVISGILKRFQESSDLSKSEKDTAKEIDGYLTRRNLIEGPRGFYTPKGSQLSSATKAQFISPSDKHKELKLGDPDLAPNAYGTRACKEYRVSITDFFIQERLLGKTQGTEEPQAIQCTHEYREHRTTKNCTVEDVLYTKALKEKHEVDLEESRKKIRGGLKQNGQFTWYHVPANNVSLSRSLGEC